MDPRNFVVDGVCTLVPSGEYDVRYQCHAAAVMWPVPTITEQVIAFVSITVIWKIVLNFLEIRK